MQERCKLCGCALHRSGGYARPTIAGRSHATKHHFVAERFFGRSRNRPGEQREPIFATCPWNAEGETEVYCYDCHEEVLHNPVFTLADIEHLAKLITLRNLAEEHKSESRDKLGGRIQLLHEAIALGIATLLQRENAAPNTP